MKNILSLFSVKSDRLKIPAFMGILIALCLLTAAWHWTPLSSFTAKAIIFPFLQNLSTGPFGPLFIIAVYVVGGLIMFPIVILIPLTALIYGPLFGPAYSMLGCLMSAMLCYLIGQGMGSETVYRIAGSRTSYISNKLSQHGFLTIATFRLLPVAPYTVVNLIAGAFRMRFMDYTTGTLVGLLPGVVIMTVLENRLEKALVKPDLWNVVLLAVLVAFVLTAGICFKRRFMKSALTE